MFSDFRMRGKREEQHLISPHANTWTGTRSVGYCCLCGTPVSTKDSNVLQRN